MSNSKRQTLAAEWDRLDQAIKDANDDKRQAADDYRKHLVSRGLTKAEIKDELDAFKKAFARRRDIAKLGADAVFERDDRVETILAEIGHPRVTRRAREITEQISLETGEITETNYPEIPDSSTSARPLTPVAADQPRPEQVEAQAPDAIDPSLSGANQSGPSPDGAFPAVVTPAADESVASGEAAPDALPAPIRKHNPETHFLNSAGIPRLHGCQLPETCAGSHRARCHTCESAFVRAEMIEQRKALRPHCLKPHDCGGVGDRHCPDCLKAHADAEGFAP